MNKNNFALVGVVGATVLALGCTSDPPPRASTESPTSQVSTAKFDPHLVALVRASDAELKTLANVYNVGFGTGGEPRFKVLVKLSDAEASIPGVTITARFGQIVSALATRDGLRQLGEHAAVERVEISHRASIHNEAGSAESSIQRGEITVANPTASFPFVARAGQTVSILMAKEGITGTTTKVFASTLRICTTPTCSSAPLATATSNGAGGDARVTYTFPSANTFYVQASGGAGQAGKFALTYIGDSKNGTAFGTKAKATANNGTGVIVGIVDTGIDWCHPDFIDPTTGFSRILYLWDQSLTAGIGEQAPAEFPAIGGVEYTNATINAALASCASATQTGVRERDIGGHGTHVSGTAAGNGTGTKDPINEPSGRYAGAAPKADLIVVKGLGSDIQMQHLDEGLLYIKRKANALNKPFVINNSWGDDFAAFDGSTMEEKVVSSVGGRGGLAVFAAGNTGYFRTHATSPTSAPAIGTADSFFLKTRPCTATSDAGAGDCSPRYVQLWVNGADTYDLTLTGPGNSTHTFPAAQFDPNNGNMATVAGLAVQLYADVTPEPNGAKNYVFVIPPAATNVPTAGEFWNLSLTRLSGSTGNGKWDAYSAAVGGSPVVYFNDTVTTPSTNVHVHRSISVNGQTFWYGSQLHSPGTAKGVLQVAALSAANMRWLDGTVAGGGYTETPDSNLVFPELGDLAYYSSRGPTRDGRAHPHVAAPGTNVMSTLSRWASAAEFSPELRSRDGQHAAISGTSMATPNVTGAVALILQADPTNFPRPLIRNSAVRDSVTADPNNNGWGPSMGKADVKQALALLAADAPPTVASLSANPASGPAGGTTTFTAVAHDPDGDGTIQEYLWDFDNDGLTDEFTTTATATMIAPSPTVQTMYTARVIAVDNAGRTAATTTTWTVQPGAVADAGVDGSTEAGTDGGIILQDAGHDAADSGNQGVDSGTGPNDSGSTPHPDATTGMDDAGNPGDPPPASGVVLDAATGGAPKDAATPAAAPADTSGCNCSTVGNAGTSSSTKLAGALPLFGLLALGARRRRRSNRR